MSTSDAASDEQPGRDHGLVAEHAHPARRHRGEDHQHDRLREEHRAGLDRRVAEHLLRVLRQQEDGAEQREERQRDRAARRREARVLEEAHVEHRVRRLSSHTKNPARMAPPIDEAAEHRRRRPAVARAFDDGPQQQRRGRRSTGPSRAGRACPACGSLASRARAGSRATSAMTTTGTFTRNTEPHQKCCSSTPPAIGSDGDADRRHAGPHADRLGALAWDRGTRW